MARKGLTITLIWIVLMTSGGFINNYKYTYVYGVKIDIKQLLLCTMQVHDKIGKKKLRGGGVFVQKCFNSFETILLFPKS